MSTDALSDSSTDLDETGPIDYLVVEFPGNKMTGEGFPLLVDLVDAGHRVLVHCVTAENRAPALAAAYLRTRGAAPDEAIERASEALGHRPKPFLLDAVRQVEPRA